MPYKNKEDKRKNAIKNYNKDKPIKNCAWDECRNTLPTSRNKFCSDECSDKFFTRKIRLEKQKKRELNDIDRCCAYEECGKQLPKGIHAQKKYCPDTDCYRKQNRLEAQRRIAIKRANKVEELYECANDTCTNEFAKKRKIQIYCCGECRKQQTFRNSEKARLDEVDNYKSTKDEAKRVRGNPKDIFIPSKFLGVRLSSKPTREHKKYEIKHFSAKWLEDLYNNRVTA